MRPTGWWRLPTAWGGAWQWQYDAAGNLVARINSVGRTERYEYSQGLLQRVLDDAHRAIELQYDSTFSLSEMRTPQGLTRWLRDGWGQARKITDARGNVQWRELDLLGRVLKLHEPDGNVRSFTYDGLDNVTRVQDRHHDVRYAYRGLGRLIRRVESGTAVEFLHDTEEQLRAIVNEHGLTHRFELDGWGDVVSETGFDGLTRRYLRNVGGQIEALTLPGGQQTRYAYDQAGRAIGVTYADGSVETYEYRVDGALVQAINSASTVSFERDVLGRVLREVQNGHIIEYEYDGLGQRIGLNSSLGVRVHLTRTLTGDVEQMQAGSWQVRFERDAQGLEMQRALSSSIRLRWKRDSFGRPTEQLIHGGPRQPERLRHYAWQVGGRLTAIQDSREGLTRFEHDALGNLAATAFADGTQQLRRPDAVGNLFRTAQSNDRRYGPAGQLLAAGGTRYNYDEAGNLTRKITAEGDEWTYTWTPAGRLAEVIRPDGQLVRFTYDALGRRISKASQGLVTRWVWDGYKPLHEWTEAAQRPAAPVTTWLFEEGRLAPLAKLVGADAYGVVTDHLGTPLQMHDQAGQPVWAAELDSYGQVRKVRGAQDACPFRFQGQYEDPETGLYYNHFRYYDPEAGQYISQDPIGLLGGVRAYGYVHDPSSYVDPLGLAPWPPGGFKDWFDNASVADVLANKQDVSNALRGSGGMHEMFPVSMAAKAKELGFSHDELMNMTRQRGGLTFQDVPDRFGQIHSGPHSTVKPLPAGQSSKASSWFHKNLMADLDGATTKAEALDIINRHHNTHCPR